MTDLAAVMQQMKKAFDRFEAGYALMTEARYELSAVSKQFKLDTIHAPVAAAQPASATNGDGTDTPTFEVAVWLSEGAKTKGYASIGDSIRIPLFEGNPEKGIILQGPLVPSNLPEGTSLKDASIGYCMIKAPATPGGPARISIIIERLGTWFNGELARFVSDNPKAPHLKATMHKSEGGGGTSKQDMSALFGDVPLPPPSPTVAPDPLQALMSFNVAVPVAPAPVAAPSLEDFFSAGKPTSVDAADVSAAVPHWLTND
jgi:hypothetical protein